MRYFIGYKFYHTKLKKWVTVTDLFGNDVQLTDTDGKSYILIKSNSGVRYNKYCNTLHEEHLKVYNTDKMYPSTTIPVATKNINGINTELYKITKNSYIILFEFRNKKLILDYTNISKGSVIFEYIIKGHHGRKRGLKHLYEHIKCHHITNDRTVKNTVIDDLSAYTSNGSLYFSRYNIGLAHGPELFGEEYLSSELALAVKNVFANFYSLLRTPISSTTKHLLEREKLVVINEATKYSKDHMRDLMNREGHVTTNALFQIHLEDLKKFNLDKDMSTIYHNVALIGSKEEIESYTLEDLVDLETELYSENVHFMNLICNMKALETPECVVKEGEEEKEKSEDDKLLEKINHNLLPIAKTILDKMVDESRKKYESKPVSAEEWIENLTNEFKEVKTVLEYDNLIIMENEMIEPGEMIVTLSDNCLFNYSNDEKNPKVVRDLLNSMSREDILTKCVDFAISSEFDKVVRDEAGSLYYSPKIVPFTSYDKNTPLNSKNLVSGRMGVISTDNENIDIIINHIKHIITKQLVDAKYIMEEYLIDSINTYTTEYTSGFTSFKKKLVLEAISQNIWSSKAYDYESLISNMFVCESLKHRPNLQKILDELRRSYRIVIIVNNKDDKLKSKFKLAFGKLVYNKKRREAAKKKRDEQKKAREEVIEEKKED